MLTVHFFLNVQHLNYSWHFPPNTYIHTLRLIEFWATTPRPPNLFYLSSKFFLLLFLSSITSSPDSSLALTNMHKTPSEHTYSFPESLHLPKFRNITPGVQGQSFWYNLILFKLHSSFQEKKLTSILHFFACNLSLGLQDLKLHDT